MGLYEISRYSVFREAMVIGNSDSTAYPSARKATSEITKFTFALLYIEYFARAFSVIEVEPNESELFPLNLGL